MTHFDIYLLSRLDIINSAGHSFVIMASILYILRVLAYVDNVKLKESLIIAPHFFIILGGLIILLTPTTKEAAFIYIAPAVVNNEDLQETIKQIPKLSNLGLEYLSDILEKKE